MGDGVSGQLSTNQKWALAGGMTATLGGTYILTQTSAAGALGLSTAGGFGVSISLSSAGAALSGVGTTIVGALAAIPVAGWIALAVIAVAALVWYFWDDIKAFFTKLWNWFKATIVYDWIVNTAVPWVVDTANNVWNWVTDTAVPWVVGTATTVWDKITSVVTTTTVTTVAVATTTVTITEKEVERLKKKLKNIWNVYDIHVIIPGPYRDYTRGLGFKNVPMQSKAIYKYGITTYNSVKQRYASFAWIDKERYIYLRLGKAFAAKEWYKNHVDYFVARNAENGLISAYVITHAGKFPPGNTGYY